MAQFRILWGNKQLRNILLYYIVVNNGATAPTAAQVVAGISYTGATSYGAGSVDFVSSDVYEGIPPVSGLAANTSYDQYWVSYDGVDYGTVTDVVTITTSSAGTLIITRPTSDISAGGWTPSTGSTLYGVLDEVSADDADYISTYSASTSEVALGAVTDPVSSSSHTIRYRAKGASALTVQLVQGTTVIASHVPTLTSSFQLFSFTLSGAEADSITNYSDLRLRFISS